MAEKNLFRTEDGARADSGEWNDFAASDRAAFECLEPCLGVCLPKLFELAGRDRVEEGLGIVVGVPGDTNSSSLKPSSLNPSPLLPFHVPFGVDFRWD